MPAINLRLIRVALSGGRPRMSELDHWKSLLVARAVSRREFMGRAAALGASSAAVSTMLSKASAATTTETPKSGGRWLGLAGGSTTDSLDSGSYDNSVMIRQPRSVQRPRRMGRGRQAGTGTGRELGAEPTAPRNGSSTSARASPSRTARSLTPTTRSIRSICIAATPSRAAPAR